MLTNLNVDYNKLVAPTVIVCKTEIKRNKEAVSSTEGHLYILRCGDLLYASPRCYT